MSETLFWCWDAKNDFVSRPQHSLLGTHYFNAVIPSEGPQTGGTVITIDGINFWGTFSNGNVSVIVGNVTATNVEWQLPRGGPHVPSPLYYEGRLYFVNDTGIVTCLDAQTGETLWQTRLRGRFSMSPIEANGQILVTSETGTTSIFKAGAAFELLATNEVDDDILATTALVNGRLYFRTKGRLLCIGDGSAKPGGPLQQE